MKLLTNVYAAGNPIPENIEDPLAGTFGLGANLSMVLGTAMNILLAVGWALVFITGGLAIIKYILSKGDPKETKMATSWGLYIAVGAFILFFITVLKFIAFDLVRANHSWGINGVTNFLTP